MSEEVKSQATPKEVSDIECSICGKDGGPQLSCEICNGNTRYAQKRHFTLTEERQGLNQEEKNSRYGPYGGVTPKIANLPGSMNPFKG